MVLLALGPSAAAQAQAQSTKQTSGSDQIDVALPATTTPEITAAQAGDGVLLAAADRVELASSLAEATSESGVCFGYVVQLSDSGVPQQDAVSSAGPNQRAATGPSCPKGAIELQVSLTYTCGSCESEDSASWSVVSTVPGLSSGTVRSRLVQLSPLSSGDLLGNDDDKALRDATAALPLTLDDAVPAEPAKQEAAPGGDHLTGKPGSDWLRANGIGMAVSIVVLLIALATVFCAWRIRRAQRTAPRRSANGRFAAAPARPATPATATSDAPAADAPPTGGPPSDASSDAPPTDEPPSSPTPPTA
ncbi:hypothetical protein PAI11_40730 [Patulibacter medicamentivorans]|uniref:Uncharacterized protein n=1 Tax=Patulibacter medicamentivorans TaxID=1097667 RepID=H0EB46_9ACTN|nr:hypothetical protein [Patulibacter medicamentivorans]EHN09121.1 hypothetical protein PAI11_40730 [Patulibacter medicamentivorans]